MKRIIALDDKDLDRMAHELAGHVIESRCTCAGEDALEKAITEYIQKRPRRRRVDFAAYYRFLEKHEARFAKGVRSVWADESRQMIANMKRTPKGLMGARISSSPFIKDAGFNALFDQWLYPQGPMKKALEKAYKDVAKKLLLEAVAREAAQWNLNTSWDVINPNVEKWLKDYSPKYAGEIERESYDALKRTLLEGWDAGESIPDLTKRVRETFDGWEKWRAERLARTESIRGSGQGALETYRASGVVDRVGWMATPTERTCEICNGLDGKVVEIGDAFFDDDYGDGTSPPAHPNCRCAVYPVLEGEEV